MDRNEEENDETSSDSDYIDGAEVASDASEEDDLISFSFETIRSDELPFPFDDESMNSNGDSDDEEWTVMSDNDPTEHYLIYDDVSSIEDGVIDDVDMDQVEKRSEENQNEKQRETSIRIDNEANTEPSWVTLPCYDTEYSDWQINVVFESKFQDTIEVDIVSYLVHRFKIGPQSNYFKSIFQQDPNYFSEAQNRISTIQFPVGMPVELGPGHFERFLDFLYSDVVPGEWDKHEMLSLLYLADYFGVEELRCQAMHCIRYNLAFDSSHEWIASAYQLADSLSIDEFLFTIEWLCRCNTDYFTRVWAQLPTIDLKRNLVYRLCETKKADPRNVTEAFFIGNVEWGKLVLHVLQSSPEVVDASLFSKITAEEIFNLRNWSMENALEFLKHEQRLKLDEPESMKLTQLQEFCIEWLCGIPGSIRDSEETVKTLAKLKPAIMQNTLLQLMKDKAS